MGNLAKIFISVLNNRLLDWSSANDVKSDAQFRFKPGFGTVDAIFALHGMISHHIHRGKMLYCCFIDYKKNFRQCRKCFINLLEAESRENFLVLFVNSKVMLNHV